MTIYEKLITAVTVVAAILCGGQQARADRFRGEKTLGICVGYNTYNRRPLAGAQFTYRFNQLLRISPSVEYIFRNDGLDAFLFDLNMEFVFPLAQGRCDIFPLAGVNFSTWNYHQLDYDVEYNIPDGDTFNESRLGFNAGAGMGVNITGSLRLTVSAVYTLVKEFDGVNISAGIHYRF